MGTPNSSNEIDTVLRGKVCVIATGELGEIGVFSCGARLVMHLKC